jgi:hypothetical protein
VDQIGIGEIGMGEIASDVGEDAQATDFSVVRIPKDRARKVGADERGVEEPSTAGWRRDRRAPKDRVIEVRSGNTSPL